MKGDQVEKFLNKSRRNEYAGKGILLYRVKKIFDCSDENFFSIREWWSNCSLGEPSNRIGDARGRCCSDVDMMRAVMRKSRAKIETGDTVPSPGTASFGWLVYEDRSAGRGDRMRAEIKLSTGKAMVSGYRWGRLPWEQTVEGKLSKRNDFIPIRCRECGCCRGKRGDEVVLPSSKAAFGPVGTVSTSRKLLE